MMTITFVFDCGESARTTPSSASHSASIAVSRKNLMHIPVLVFIKTAIPDFENYS